jgi:hypothetical protein
MWGLKPDEFEELDAINDALEEARELQAEEEREAGEYDGKHVCMCVWIQEKGI